MDCSQKYPYLHCISPAYFYAKNLCFSHAQERKLLECEEAIEAIDTAIEYKNNLICGRSPSASLSDSYGDNKETRSRGEQMLMARLDKLSHDEIKTLLYRYFQKVSCLSLTYLYIYHHPFTFVYCWGIGLFHIARVTSYESSYSAKK